MTEPLVDTPPVADALKPIVVLLVDDQLMVGRLLQLMLKSETDINLHCCMSPLEAIALANRILPAVILQDLIMPDIDGLAMVRSFRENPQTADASIVVLSANDDAANRARAVAAGADGYLVKPPSKADLLASIRRRRDQ